MADEAPPTQRVDLGMLEMPPEENIDADIQLDVPVGPGHEIPPEMPEGFLPEDDMPTVAAEAPPADALTAVEPTMMDAHEQALNEIFPGELAASEPIVPPALNLASPDLSDIGRFGNSDVSAVGEGSLRYNIHVTGIDTADVRSQFREAVTDKKMMWDAELILRSIKNGEVKLTAMSAVKAYIIVSRLRGLPVQIRWEQYAISQT
jgi:hypothetical protein